MLFIVLTLICLSQSTRSQFTPENAGQSVAPSLLECYNNTLLLTRDNRPAATANVFINLMRKIEDGNPQLTVQQLALSILQRFRQDGILFSKDADQTVGLPYSPRGKEAHKNRLQLRKLTPGNAINFRNDSLNPLERCSFHFMVSSVIDALERGNEMQVCNKLMHYTSRIRRDTEGEIEVTDIQSTGLSACPLESGVIYTKWGTVKGGLLLSGIAAGLERQQVKTGPELTADNLYASTIAGELSEVSLGSKTSTIRLGNPGAWNSTTVPKYYFIEKNNDSDLLLTDAEIRGGLDGLYLGLNIQKWRSKDNNIKLSQIFDLYYSTRGVFGDIKACNRKYLFTNLTSSEKLRVETGSFNNLLKGQFPTDITFSPEQLKVQVEKSVDGFNNYLPLLTDLDCSSEDSIIERVSADLALFVDTNWDYRTLASFISSTLDNLDVNKYETSYTIYSGSNTDILVNKTHDLVDFYQKYNETQHKSVNPGFNYKKVFETIEQHYKANLNNVSEYSSQSFAAILIPRNTPTDGDIEFIKNKNEYEFRGKLPDLRVLAVVPTSNRDSYSRLVSNANDLFTLDETSSVSSEESIKTTIGSVVARVKKIPRNIVNPHCGSEYKPGINSFRATLYAEPEAINFYRIAPNYYANGKTLKISGQGYGNVSVCYSLTEANPRGNSTGVHCKQIINNEESIDISSFCSGSISSCPPIYISAEGSTTDIVRCTSLADRCRFPDNIKFMITLENVECNSGNKILTGFLTIFIFSALLALNHF